MIDVQLPGAAVFDTDGVLTDTASIHFKAWQRMFSALSLYLQETSWSTLPQSLPFKHSDYVRYVDGKKREDGAADFLASRGVSLLPGELRHWCSFKDTVFTQLLCEDGVTPFRSSLDFVIDLRSHGVPTAVVSSSRHCEEIVSRAVATSLFDERVDGLTAIRMGLPGKPDPAMFLEATRRLGREPADTLLVEDAVSGVKAGKAGGFYPVIGLDRGAGKQALTDAGADIVVDDLSEIRLVFR